MHPQIFKPTLLLSLFLLCISCTSTNSSATNINKKLFYRPTGVDRLKVTFKPLKSSYAVNEKVTFSIRGNRDFYLYLFNLSQHPQPAVLILPNALQTAQQIKYSADHTWIVPNPELEFYADRPGHERIVMIASSEPLDWGDLQLRKSKHFWLSNHSAVIHWTSSLIISANKTANHQLVIEELNLAMVGVTL